MKVLFVNPVYPSRRQVFQAANIVVFELLAEMARQPGFQVGFLKLTLDRSNPEELVDCSAELVAAGVEVLPPLEISVLPKATPTRLERWFGNHEPGLEDVYPIYAHRAEAAAAIADWTPDALVVPWSEVATALFADVDVPVKYAYYGQPDPKVPRTRQEFPWYDPADKSPAVEGKRQAGFARADRMEAAHLEIMRRYDVIGVVALNDALWYRDRGLGHSAYVRNIWFDRFPGEVFERKRAHELPEHRIAGNVGRLSATGNTIGLALLGHEIVPQLRRVLGDEPFRVEIFGAGQAIPRVDQWLRGNPEVQMRGFVEDIDLETQRCKIFLVANNGGVLKGGHTRYLHAWSLGMCVVAYHDAALSMPEIIHGHNALLGRDTEEVANLIAQALHDPALRERLAHHGYETFKTFFTAAAVVPEIASDLRRIHRHKTSRAPEPALATV